VKTYVALLQSGNLVFRGDARTTSDIERLLEAEAGKQLGLHPDYTVMRLAGVAGAHW
jgi:uncharacterized protein (DUF1697 family)